MIHDETVVDAILLHFAGILYPQKITVSGNYMQYDLQICGWSRN